MDEDVGDIKNIDRDDEDLKSIDPGAKQKQKPLHAPKPISIESPGDLPPSQTERAGTVSTLAEELKRLKELADISIRKILAIVLTVFVLICMAAYFIYMMRVNDSKGLTDFITVLVGILGIITGYYFSSKNEASN